MKKPLDVALSTLLDDPDRVESFLLEHSGLPGPRGNLELAASFSSHAPALFVRAGWRQRLMDWASIDARQVDTNHPRVYLPFVANQALGAVYLSCDIDLRSIIDGVLRGSANDERWRMREACAIGLQAIGMQSPEDLLALLREWLVEPSLLDHRAVLAALAHPPMLKGNTLVTSFAFQSANAALVAWLSLSGDDKRTDSGKALQKGLAYAPSVFVAADSLAGFRMLEEWAGIGEIDAAKIVVANLRKARLARYFPDEVEAVGLRLESSMSG